MIPDPGMALHAAPVSPNGTAPRCEHLDGLAPVKPRSGDCRACRGSQDRPSGQDRRADLVVCLSCGWVACGDDSPKRHARAHYEETDHPVTTGLAPGMAWRWCYVHQRHV